ncbi:TspO/MBR family protein [[Leptolyngbya] sp. PCC 7376]|uniref:TspO/MBR family protein n=1 Tax=[Leptolyngbya] sp. PCC 7376 TaxID=111781 RepID=UPI0002DB431D|nr:tryptophan-rich sensory protein [[Leptolyngbya] sp. PCC 7376]
MDSKNIVKSGVQTVMGVEEKANDDKKIATDLENPQFDGKATVNYILGTALQIGLLVALLWGMNFLLPQVTQYFSQPWMTVTAVCGFFAFFTLRSRLFSPLDNTRSGRRYDSVQRPTWSPPPLAFPIVWMSIAVLRVVSAYYIWLATSENFLSLPLIIYAIHLALGDTWNTIFTVEGRLGAAVPVVIMGPLLSSFAVAIAYWQVLPLAAWIILPSCLWLTVATVLVISIWQLNGQEPLYPLVAQSAE